MGAAALLLSGCYSIIGQSTQQQGVIGDLTVKTQLCIEGLASTTPGPDARCTGGSPQPATYDFQQFVGYLVPAWVKAPDSIAVSLPGGAQQFARSTAYEAALATPNGYPAQVPAGSKWIGFASGLLPKIQQGVDQREEVVAQLGLGADAGATLDLVTTTGWRHVREAGPDGEAWPISRPLLCQNSAGESQNEQTADAVCVASVWPTLPAGAGQDGNPIVITPTSVPLNTASLASPGATTVQAGTTTTLSFGAKTSNAGTAASLPLAANTTIPGGSATAPAQLALGANGSVDVAVAIPAGTPAGTYAVELSAAGGLRTASVPVTVSVPTVPQSAKVITREQLKAIAQQIAKDLGKKGGRKALRGSKFSAKFSLGAAGKVEVLIKGNRVGKKKIAPTFAKGSLVVSAGQAAAVKLAPTKDGKKKLKGKGKAKAYVVVKVGTLSSDSVRVTIR